MHGEEEIAEGTLLFGPGERLADLMNLVGAAAPRARVRQMADLDELAERPEHRGGQGVLLVDADVLPAEDVGYLRRFLAREARFKLTLVGEDSSRRVARTLLRLPRVRWMGWPPDLDDVRGLVAPARAAALAVRTRAAPAPAPPRSPARVAPAAGEAVDELARIEAILDLPQEAEPLDVGEAGMRATPAPARGQPTAPPRYFRDQVADLADIAQRIEGGLSSARESGALADPKVEALSGDVARLVQFTRTLSYLSAAPPPGDQEFDLAELIDTLVDGLPKKGPQSPRWLARSSGPLPVRSDRELLLQAFDALLFLAEKCSGRGEIVRVQAGPVEPGAGHRARVTLDFSSGPLADLEPAQVLEPYGLRRTLPDLGPNALSAAIGIIAGQGGRLELRKPSRGRFSWILELPLIAARTPGREGEPAPEGGTPARASRGAADPFA
jgi:hypothetical protein